MIKKIVILVACLLALLAIINAQPAAKACSKCVTKCRQSDNFKVCFQTVCQESCPQLKKRKNKPASKKAAPTTEAEADAEFAELFKKIGASIKEDFSNKYKNVKSKVHELAKKFKGTEALTDSELSCLNNCKRGMMCAAVCIPAQPIRFEEESDSMNSAGHAAANWARSQAGSCYSQAERMGRCFDCSSLVYRAYKAAGKDIGATSTGAYPGRTHQVHDLQVGDILWRSGHVGLYLGNNQVVNAENPRTGVQVRSLDYFRKYLGYTKIYRPN